MAIGLWSGGYGMSYPAYTKFSNMQTAKETSPQNQIPDTQQDIEALNLSPIKVDTRVRLDPLMKMQSLETLDMQKAIADMQEDSVRGLPSVCRWKSPSSASGCDSCSTVLVSASL